MGLAAGADLEPGGAERADVRRGARRCLARLVDRAVLGRAIQSLFVSKVGAPAGHTSTYLGFSDGTIGYMVNPCVPNPAACAQYRFHVGDAWVDLPLWHGGYHASVKSLRHLSVTGQQLNATNYVTIDYKLDPAAAVWTAFPNVFDSFTYEMAPMPIYRQRGAGAVQGASAQHDQRHVAAGLGGLDRPRAASETLYADRIFDPLLGRIGASGWGADAYWAGRSRRW